MPLLNQLAAQSYDGKRTYADVVHFVHVIVIEPHPQRPDLNPYSGRVGEAQYSTVRQPRNYAERVAVARQVAPLLQGNQILLVDELTLHGANNPIWCTYGTAPNSAYLIAQDGMLHTAQLWLDVNQMQKAIDALLK